MVMYKKAAYRLKGDHAMKKLVALLLVLASAFALCACGSMSSSQAQASGGPDQAGVAADAADSAMDDVQAEIPAPEEATAPTGPVVSLEFDPHAYRDTNDNDYFNALAYCANSGGFPSCATVKYRAFDAEGKALMVYDRYHDRYTDEFKTNIFVPAFVKDYPVAFTLAAGFGFDVRTGETMPDIDHLEFEAVEISAVETEDLREYFTPGEPEIRDNHIYLYVKFDQEIADNYTSLFADYTLLGYSDGELIAVCCRNDFPFGSSAASVAYAVENNDSSLLVYHRVPREPVEKWEFYLGCIAGE